MSLNSGPNRREYVGRCVDALLEYWLTGTHDPDMAEWWTTDEAGDTALEVVHVILQAIEESGHKIVKSLGSAREVEK